MLDEDGRGWQILNRPRIVAAARENRGIVFIGLPGIGKSTALKQLHASERANGATVDILRERDDVIAALDTVEGGDSSLAFLAVDGVFRGGGDPLWERVAHALENHPKLRFAAAVLDRPLNFRELGTQIFFAADMAFTADETEALIDLNLPTLPENLRAALYARYRGQPLGTRIALESANLDLRDGRWPTLDAPPPIEGVLSRMRAHRDILALSETARFIDSTSTLHHFTAIDAAAVTGGRIPPWLWASLASSLLVSEMNDPVFFARALRWRPAVREHFNEQLNSDDHGRQLRLAAAEALRGPDFVLHRVSIALDLRDYAALERLLLRYFRLVSVYALEPVRLAITSLPPAVRELYPHIRLYGAVQLVQRKGMSRQASSDLHAFLSDSHRITYATPLDRALLASHRVIAATHLGDRDRIIDMLERYRAVAFGPAAEQLRDMLAEEPHFAALFASDMLQLVWSAIKVDNVRFAFELVHDSAASAHEFDRTDRDSNAVLHGLQAFTGIRSTAEIQAEVDADRLRLWTLPGYLEVLSSLDVGDDEAASSAAAVLGRAPADAVPQEIRDHLSLIASALAGPAMPTRRIGDILQRYRDASSTRTVSTVVVFGAVAALLSKGSIDDARATLDYAAGDDGFSDLAWAMWALATGDARAAVDHLEHERRQLLPPRYGAIRAMLATAAHLRLGNTASAVAALHVPFDADVPLGVVRFSLRFISHDEAASIAELGAKVAADFPLLWQQSAGDRRPFAVRQVSVVLTATEVSVLRLVRDGRSNLDIARIRTVSVNTVRAQMGSIIRKLGVSTRADAAARASELGLLEDV